MKRCKCEHWQICPTCYPQGFDEQGVRKPVEIPPSREELQRDIVSIREQVEKLSQQVCDECDGSGWQENAVEGRVPCVCMTEAEPYQLLQKQVKKLTKERDKYNQEFKDACGALCKQSHECAALAEQNEKLRKVLLRLACLGNGDQYGNSIGNCIAQEALSLPDLATPALNQIKAEAYREAAEIVENTDVYTFIHGGTCYDDGGLSLSSAAMAIRAKADEMEQIK